MATSVTDKDEALREAARQFYLERLAAGRDLSGKDLAARFGMGERWGRERKKEALARHAGTDSGTARGTDVGTGTARAAAQRHAHAGGTVNGTEGAVPDGMPTTNGTARQRREGGMPVAGVPAEEAAVERHAGGTANGTVNGMPAARGTTGAARNGGVPAQQNGTSGGIHAGMPGGTEQLDGGTASGIAAGHNGFAVARHDGTDTARVPVLERHENGTVPAQQNGTSGTVDRHGTSGTGPAGGTRHAGTTGRHAGTDSGTARGTDAGTGTARAAARSAPAERHEAGTDGGMDAARHAGGTRHERHGKRRVPVWPVWLLALPAAVAIWSGWVELGKLCGFGKVQPLPGITDWTIDTSVTLPVGMEAYAAYAMYVWLSGRCPARARRMARWSAVLALVVGFIGQAAYHLMEARGIERAPWGVVLLVSAIPVAVVGMGGALAHLVRHGADDEAGDTYES